MTDWVDELMAEVPEQPRNPHWACGTQVSPPCPTGEHRVVHNSKVFNSLTGWYDALYAQPGQE